MRHLDDLTTQRLALDRAGSGEAERAREHLSACPDCRNRIAETKKIWAALLEADPAQDLPDVPLWPDIAGRLDTAGASQAPALRPTWTLAWSEARRAPLVYAALAAVALGVGGGQLAHRILLVPGPTEETAAPDLIEASNLEGMSESSLAYWYLAEDLEMEAEEGQP